MNWGCLIVGSFLGFGIACLLLSLIVSAVGGRAFEPAHKDDDARLPHALSVEADAGEREQMPTVTLSSVPRLYAVTCGDSRGPREEPMNETRKARPELAPHQLSTNRKRQAHGTGGEAWWYEDERGIDVYQHVAPGIVTSARIPWSQLIRAAERCGFKFRISK